MSPCPFALGYRSDPHNSPPCCAPCFRPYSPIRRAPVFCMKTQPPFLISLQPATSPGAPSRSGLSVPRRASVSPLGDGTSPARGLSSWSGFAGAPTEGGAPFARTGASGWRGQLGLPEGPGSLSAPRLTRGEQGGRQRASAVCRAGHRSRFHGPCGGICLPASKATHGL